MRSDYETLLVSRDGPVATVALNRPANRNSIGGPMMVELHSVISEVASDATVRVLVLRGEGAAKARELYFMPGKFDAAEALRIGLVSKVSAAGDFEADLADLTARLGRAAPLAITAMKSNFLAAEKVGFSDFIALESEKHTRL